MFVGCMITYLCLSFCGFMAMAVLSWPDEDAFAIYCIMAALAILVGCVVCYESFRNRY